MKPVPSGHARTPPCVADMVPGYPRGSMILTLDGALPAEFLSPGDRIISRDSGLVVLQGIKVVEIVCDTVTVEAGALGPDRPDCDVVLPVHQQVLVRDCRAQTMFGRDQALTTIGQLADGEFIRSTGRQTLTLIQLHFDALHILYVDGMELACEAREPLRNAA
ncbi:Hint domain-containing protein [Alisedimentitalea sp. MJ-SS2]|uniref:Hint domain-containing protein n=1 Tax=Aliisedimentitalea sp. MJ-SS2 TaxID=3049795 RepID=UPI00291519F3|nr:Hint domain-containing protein [Alisedimentitalea sp. MJ-SS2]MDU8926505.1 Hint domain-containing protein [Alisedimentitalea sp. MJ-SS2]